MVFRIEMILGAMTIILIVFAAKEYFQNDKQLTTGVRTKVRVSLVFIVVILFNLLMF